MSTAVKPNTAVATVEPPAKPYNLRERVSALAPFRTENARKLIEAVLPTGVTFERVMAEVYFAVQKNPKLAECTPESFVMAVAQCVKWDLEIGVKAHVVPYGKEATAVRDWKGDAELVVRCGAARYVDAQNVFANELFEHEQGTAPFIRHRPIFDKAKRGKLIASYAVAKVNSTDIKIVVMGVDDIEAVRQKYSKQWKGGALEDIPWYGPKTCVHRVVKLLPTSPKLAKVLAEFDEEDALAGAAARTELPVADVMRQLESGDSSASSAGVEARSQSPATTEASATHAPTGERAPIDHYDEARDEGDWRPGIDEIEVPAPKRSALELFPMPFGPTVGQPMGDLSTADLTSAYRWALKNRNHAEFVEKAAQLLDDRKNGDAMEPDA
jgi:recombination protein RecT